MDMKLPEASSGLGSLLSILGRSTTETSGESMFEAVDDAQLLDAIAAMQRGDIEFVILEDGDAFLQAAGEGEGPYALQFCEGDPDAVLEVEGGVAIDALRQVMRAYLGGDRGWQQSQTWTPLRA